jgi:hypothetical protein
VERHAYRRPTRNPAHARRCIVDLAFKEATDVYEVRLQLLQERLPKYLRHLAPVVVLDIFFTDGPRRLPNAYIFIRQ